MAKCNFCFTEAAERKSLHAEVGQPDAAENLRQPAEVDFTVRIRVNGSRPEDQGAEDKITELRQNLSRYATIDNAEAHAERVTKDAQNNVNLLTEKANAIKSEGMGDGVYKIGMTRRLEPLERVKEIRDAVAEHYGLVTFRLVPEAEQYRTTLNVRKEAALASAS